MTDSDPSHADNGSLPSGGVTPEFARGLPDATLVAQLARFGIAVDRETFAGMVRDHDSVDGFVENIGLPEVDDDAELDWVWASLMVLWERWVPERPSFEMLGDRMQAGYELDESLDTVGSSELWLGVWRDLAEVCERRGIDSLHDLDERFCGRQSISNWSQDLELALLNAGREDPKYLHQRIAYCREFLERFVDLDPAIAAGFRDAIVESCAALGVPVPELPPKPPRGRTRK